MIIFSYTGLPQVKISQKVLGGYYFSLTLYNVQQSGILLSIHTLMYTVHERCLYTAQFIHITHSEMDLVRITQIFFEN